MRTTNRLMLLACACWSLPTHAAPATAQSNVSTAEASGLLAEFADCVAAKKARQAPIQAFLRAIPDQPGFNEAALKAADLTCLNKAAARSHSRIEMRLQPESFREALFPALYRRDFGRTGPVAGLAAAAPLRLSDEFDGKVTDLSPAFVAERQLGDCVARKEAAASHALLVAKSSSSEEAAAITRLKPAIAACAKPDQAVSPTGTALRAMLGEAMYKLSRATTAR